MSTQQRPQGYKIDLVHQHQLCESNFVRLQQLLPDLHEQNHTCLHVCFNHNQTAQVDIKVKQRAPYTTYLHILVLADWGEWLSLPELEVALYHDVRMAEVIFSKRSKKLAPIYNYPNPDMHQPNEKEQWNQFLSELIDYCLKADIIPNVMHSK